jgi:predicted RNA binding protein YcfA (HicA-like mRNA interferase family)
LKLPRNVSGLKLAKRLRVLGYQVTRQTGSHIRLTREEEAKHSVTIPKHKAMKIGTLRSILRDVSLNTGISEEELIRILF